MGYSSAAQEVPKGRQSSRGGWMLGARGDFILRQAPEQKTICVPCTAVCSVLYPPRPGTLLPEAYFKTLNRKDGWVSWKTQHSPPHETVTASPELMAITKAAATSSHITEERSRGRLRGHQNFPSNLLPSLCFMWKWHLRYTEKCVVTWSAPDHSCTPPFQSDKSQVWDTEKEGEMWRKRRLQRTWKWFMIGSHNQFHDSAFLIKPRRFWSKVSKTTGKTECTERHLSPCNTQQTPAVQLLFRKKNIIPFPYVKSHFRGRISTWYSWNLIFISPFPLVGGKADLAGPYSHQVALITGTVFSVVSTEQWI